jgi:hypothetical protein
VLALKTTLSGSANGSVDLPLSAPASISCAPVDNPDVAISTAGSSLVGLVLRSLDRPAEFPFDAFRLPRAAGPFVITTPAGGICAHGARTFTLPPGRYRLYLVADRSTTVTLTLHGLAGRTTVRPRRAATASTDLPTPTVPPTGNTAVMSAGSARRTTGRSLLLTLTWVPFAAVATAALGSCRFQDSDADHGVYGPECPVPYTTSPPSFGDPNSSTMITPGANQLDLEWTTYPNVPAALWGLGGWALGAGVQAQAGGVANLWLTY